MGLCISIEDYNTMVVAQKDMMHEQKKMMITQSNMKAIQDEILKKNHHHEDSQEISLQTIAELKKRLSEHILQTPKRLVWKAVYEKNGFIVKAMIERVKPSTEAEIKAWVDFPSTPNTVSQVLYLKKFIPNLWMHWTRNSSNSNTKLSYRLVGTVVEYLYQENEDSAWDSHSRFTVHICIPLSSFQKDEMTIVEKILDAVQEEESSDISSVKSSSTDLSSIEFEEIELKESIYRDENEKPCEESHEESKKEDAKEGDTTPPWSVVERYEPKLGYALTSEFLESVGSPKDAITLQHIVNYLFTTDHLSWTRGVLDTEAEPSQEKKDV